MDTMVQHWKKMVIAVGLSVFGLLLFVSGGDSVFWNTIALGGLMIYFWLFEVIPIYVTALFPLVFGVPLGVISPALLSSSYGDKFVFLFLGGFILALALEKWEVHLQISKRIIALVGKSKPRIILGFLLTTGILSMWISNTATALMMLPMALAVIELLPSKEKKSKFPLFLLLAVAYGASIGGMGTLVGSPTNTAMASSLELNQGIHVDFSTWMKIGFPAALVMLLCAFLFFYFSLGKEKKDIVHGFDLQQEKWTKNQFKVLGIFATVVLLWSFKDVFQPFFPFQYTDEGAALLGAMLLFFVPASATSSSTTIGKSSLLQWKDTEKLPWGVLLLFGGGMALAGMMKENGVLTRLSEVFKHYNDLSYIWILVVIVALAIFATEVMSNFALITAFIPIVAQFAIDSGYPILQMCIPVTLAASCAFMLPVGTPPNAIVFSSGQVRMGQMAKYGFVMNLIGLLIIVAISLLLI
jgi:solute carrier family 13 (sodium-dependent dicarboxylate transporter), member 2/3/5